MRRSILAATALLVVAVAPAARAADGDIVVRRAPGLDRHERAELRADAGVKLVETLPIEHAELVAPRDGDLATALAELRADDAVVSAEPDHRMTIAAAPDVFRWLPLWGLEQTTDADIDALAAWQRSLGTDVTVAVVDTGINAEHVDLAARIAEGGKDFVDDDDVPDDGNGHGTHVAGTIAATAGDDLIGVAPEAKVLPLRVLDNAGGGFASDVAAAFEYAADRGVRIVNASLGGEYDSLLEAVVKRHPDTLFVVAAGNDGADADADRSAYPCALPEANVLCVGASNWRDQAPSFSNYGLKNVDLSAPGTGIVSAWIGSPVALKTESGTSMASPHAAGAAALALAANPAATALQLKWALTSSVDAKPALAGKSVTGGRLNADAAVAAITGDAVPSQQSLLPVATPPAPKPTPTAPAPTPAPPEPELQPVAPPLAPADPAPAPVAPAPAPVVAPPPAAAPLRLFGVRVRGSLLRKRGKLRVRFSLTQPGDVRFRVHRRGSRRPLASWTVHGRAGANSVVVKRRLPTRRTLKRGRYTLKVGLGTSAGVR